MFVKKIRKTCVLLSFVKQMLADGILGRVALGMNVGQPMLLALASMKILTGVLPGVVVVAATPGSSPSVVHMTITIGVEIG